MSQRITECPGAHATWTSGRRYHVPVIVYRRRARHLWRKTHWVMCWNCDLALGPFDVGFAKFVLADLGRDEAFL